MSLFKKVSMSIFVKLATFICGVAIGFSVNAASDVKTYTQNIRPRYRICSGESECSGATGKGFVVCETYLKRMKSKSAKLSRCEIPEVEGFTSWPVEELPAKQNLRLIYAIEKSRLEIHRETLPDFAIWQRDLMVSMKDRQAKPALYKTKIPAPEGGEINLIAYTRNRNVCNQKSDSNEPAYAQHWKGGGLVYFQLLDEVTNNLQEIGGGFDSPSVDKAKLMSFNGRPYFISQIPSYRGFEAPEVVFISHIRKPLPLPVEKKRWAEKVCTIKIF